MPQSIYSWGRRHLYQLERRLLGQRARLDTGKASNRTAVRPTALMQVTMTRLTLTRGKLQPCTATLGFCGDVGDALITDPAGAMSPSFAAPISCSANTNYKITSHMETQYDAKLRTQVQQMCSCLCTSQKQHTTIYSMFFISGCCILLRIYPTGSLWFRQSQQSFNMSLPLFYFPSLTCFGWDIQLDVFKEYVYYNGSVARTQLDVRKTSNCIPHP
jgi:hypothetical protein